MKTPAITNAAVRSMVPPKRQNGESLRARTYSRVRHGSSLLKIQHFHFEETGVPAMNR
jgi:hypothetical protein